MKDTVLVDAHRALGARMVPFAGWNMPVLYADITTEHHAVRKAAGIFDLCHMGRVRLRGPDALELARRIQTNDADALPVGRTRYALLCDADGGVIDDVLISREEDGFLLVVNASNRDADLEFMKAQTSGLDVEIRDDSEAIAMIAIQGPRSRDFLEPLGFGAARDVRYYRFVDLPETPFGPAIVSRTGYTGEIGYELFVARDQAVSLWDKALSLAPELPLIPCGLGCRDTLRLEAGMPLYGHELDRETQPYEAGLDFAVKPHEHCVARAALDAHKAKGPQRRLVGLQVEGRRIPRQGARVLQGEREVGLVTSGTLSPTLEINIATALVEAAAADEGGDALNVDIRGHVAPARRVPLPFYKRKD